MASWTRPHGKRDLGKDSKMRDYDDDGVPYVVIERSGTGLIPFIWGALLGAAAALLLAPKSGAETQEELKERARRLRERAEGKAEELQDTLQDALARGRREVEDRYETAKKTVSEGRERAQEALDAGRKAAHAARSEVEEQVSRRRSRGKEEEAAEG
ncbi:MAG: YtxH domain-containing protein [Gemmatimonadota bacterium]|nr:MAG: YtxH domain-containing protein [Gemmatimonadota bacterium]